MFIYIIRRIYVFWYVLFVCLFWVYRPTREFFTHMDTSPLPVKGCRFWPMLDTHGHWAVFIKVPPLLWHGASIYNGHLWGPVTLTPIALRLAVELSLPVFYDLGRLSLLGFEFEHQPSACGANALTHCATAAVYSCLYIYIDLLIFPYMYISISCGLLKIFKTNHRDWDWI